MWRRPGRSRGFATSPPWRAPARLLRRRSSWWRGLPVLLLLSAAPFVAARLDPLPPPLSGIARATDGDSLRVGGERVRLLGIDAPELDQSCTRPDASLWSCGEAARRELAGLVADAPTTCLPSGRDRYGRLLAACTSSGEDLGARLVAAGLALSSTGYAAEEAAARAAAVGIWSGRFVPPRQWREEAAEAAAPGPLAAIWNWFRELTGARSLR
jgi:endonuclease YncB( thermonuclease family)